MSTSSSGAQPPDMYSFDVKPTLHDVTQQHQPLAPDEFAAFGGSQPNDASAPDDKPSGLSDGVPTALHNVIEPPSSKTQRERATSSSRSGTVAQASSAASGSSASLEAVLERVHKGLEHILSSGGVDSRPSRQTPLAPKTNLLDPGSQSEVARAVEKQKPNAVKVPSALDVRQPTANANTHVLFAKRGRKRAMTPNMVLLESIQRDIDSALRRFQRGTTSGTSPTARTSMSPQNITEADTEESAPEARDLESVIESPLAILAHISSLKIGESTEEESGDTQSVMPGSKANPTPSEQYFATGLYQSRTDREPALDPVTLGLLNEQDLARLVNIYFAHLHPFSWHLSPDIHTAQFLRDTSPFLTTVVAFICAGYDPLSRHLVAMLQSHAMFLSDRVFSEGFKTVEIVQAYILLIHFAPIENNWGDDKRWGWLGMAIRIATEIRLDKTLTASTYQFYRSVTPLRDNMFADLAKDRAKTWMLLQVVEIALCVSTGRLGAVRGLNLVNAFRVWVPRCEPSNPEYNLCAMEDLHKVYTKAIALSSGLREETSNDDGSLRESYNASWQNEMQQWRQTWPAANGYVKIVSQHATTILLSISLRFRGALRPILEECKRSAMETLRIMKSWPNDSIEFGSNLLVVNLAYAATLLIRIMSSTGMLADAEQEARNLCRAASEVLARMGQRRPTIRTLAALHATRIRNLLDTSEAGMASAAARSGSEQFAAMRSAFNMTAPTLPPMHAVSINSNMAGSLALSQQQQAFQNGTGVPVSTSINSTSAPAMYASVGLYPNAPLMPPQLDSMWDMFRVADPTNDMHGVLGLHAFSPPTTGVSPAVSPPSSGAPARSDTTGPISPPELQDMNAWMLQTGAEGMME
ncbi:hypothetical protein OIV83_001193 [Microbotryomycetes sp. JL201]|nr:hypothetical protein OIV83_001193 [Microbotryomycetes sp. JL201]